MGLFDQIFKKPAPQNIKGYFKLMSAYTPVFTTYDGGVYEMELTRAAIHAFATQCSKLKPEMSGTAHKDLGARLQYKPNRFMDTTKFLYRLATILSVCNTAFIVPVTDDTGMSITGYYPILPTMCEVVDYGGKPWMRYTFSTGEKAAIEFDRVGILTQFQYKNDLFGENNLALNPTMQLINVQNQGIIEGVKQSANIRFMAKLANIFKSTDISAERKRFTEENLSYENNSGVLMFDGKYADVKQIESKPFIVDADQMKVIQNNVYTYFGTNEKILQNAFSEDEWGAYYEGKIEPFAIQLSLVMSNMTYTEREIAHGNNIMWTANRLQYASNKTKLDVVTQLFDRGMLTRNGGREIFNMSPVKDGSKFFIRGEYLEYGNARKKEDEDADQSGTGISGNEPIDTSEGSATD